MYRSIISVFDVVEGKPTVLATYDGLVEAPNWSRDGRHLLVNADGSLFRLSLESLEAGLVRIPLGEGGYHCNNDHDFSPDGSWIAFSAATGESEGSRVFVCGAEGDGVSLVTPALPSYFHGWSPDGRWLAFVAERGDGRYELYRVPAKGGEEDRLTCTGGYDDGPEYSPDGRYIYFNSNRGGSWSIWRMPADGAGPNDGKAEQITADPSEDWFPHISPDGKRMVFLSFPPGTEGHDDRMPGVKLRMIPVPGESPEDRTPQTLLTFFGGQGSFNVNSWSPDSNRFAFVAFEPM